jgi:hypothetical protein
MNSRKKKFTINELLKWTNLKTINPKSGRKIKQSGKIYKSLQKQFVKNFKDNINPLDSTDNKDPVSQDDIWLYDESNKKIYGSIPPERLVIYQEGNFIRCFDSNSLLMMKKNNMTSHPISSKIIPEEAFQKALERGALEEKKETKKERINNLAFAVFQKLLFNSVYISEKIFMNSDKEKDNKIYHELKDFYKNNFSKEHFLIIDPENKLFEKSGSELNKLELIDSKEYILQNMEILLNCENESIKMMVIYIIVGSLTAVLPEIRKLYPDIAFTFSI